MPGQGAIVAAGAIGFRRASRTRTRPRCVARRREDMTLTSTYDHRVIQGAQSGEYLRRIEELLDGGTDFYEPSSPRTASTCAASTAAARRRNRRPPPSSRPGRRTAPAEYADEMLRAVAAGMALRLAYRRHGHLAASLDPLGTRRPAIPRSIARSYGLTPSLMAAVPASVLRTAIPRRHARRRAAAPARHLLVDDRVRSRAHRQHRTARVAARIHRVGHAHRAAIPPQQASGCSSG